MRIKFFIVVSYAFIGIGSQVILQAMQENQKEAASMLSPAGRNRFIYLLITGSMAENNTEKAQNILKEGLKLGFDVNYRHENDKTLLHHALFKNNVALARTLLEAGADPNIKDNDGNTALHYAVAYAKAPLINDLLEARANVNAKSNTGATPLMSAVVGGKIPVIKALLADPNIDIMARDLQGRTALDIAHLFKLNAIIKLLRPYYTLKVLGIDYIKKHRDKFTQEQIKQLPLELQEALQES